MPDSSPHKREIELTPDLLEFATAVARDVAKEILHPGLRHPGVRYNDVVQEALLHLMSKPPKFDPTRGASERTLIYTAVYYAVLKAAGREGKQLARYRPHRGVTDGGERQEVLDCDQDDECIRSIEKDAAVTVRPQDHLDVGDRRVAQRKCDRGIQRHRGSPDLFDEMLEFIDNEESRALCKLFIECDGNISEAARRLDSPEAANLCGFKKPPTEGAIRYRLKVLGPKMLEAGFDPASCGGKR